MLKFQSSTAPTESHLSERAKSIFAFLFLSLSASNFVPPASTSAIQMRAYLFKWHAYAFVIALLCINAGAEVKVRILFTATSLGRIAFARRRCAVGRCSFR
jgi:hypothetical protein